MEKPDEEPGSWELEQESRRLGGRALWPTDISGLARCVGDERAHHLRKSLDLLLLALLLLLRLLLWLLLLAGIDRFALLIILLRLR